MKNKETLGAITAVAAILPVIVIVLRRTLPLRAVEVLHAMAAVMLVVSTTSVVYGLSYGGALATTPFGDGSDGPLVWAVLLVGLAAGLGAWWLLHARPRSVVAVEDVDDGDVADPKAFEPDHGADVLSDDLPAARPVALPVVPRVLFIAVGAALLAILPFQTGPRGGLDLGVETVVMAVLAGLLASMPLLAAVLGDEDGSADGPAYIGCALVAGALLVEAYLTDFSPTSSVWIPPLLAGLSAGLLAPAALDVLGDLTSAVRPYAIPIGVALGGGALALSVVLSQRAILQSYSQSSTVCDFNPDSEDC
jgi:hypothetical protein